MPRKQKKTKEEKRAEDFFPVDETDVRYSVEKFQRAPPLEKSDIAKMVVEKIHKGTPLKEGREKKRKKKFVGKPKSRSRKKVSGKIFKKEFKTPEIKLSGKGPELIITEKPQAASKISMALGNAVTKNSGGVSYYEVDRDGKKIFVACAVGHLFSLHQNKSGSDFPIFDVSWKPNYLVRKKDFTKKYFDLILLLVKKAGSITVATDYDIEGEVIGFNIVRYLCGQKDASRMKFSTLTSGEINKAYDFKRSTINWGQAIAGETRHFLDWFYGINLSRALMSAVKSTGRFRVMSIGRVQGPALNLIVKKEKEIQSFKSKPYWQVFINVKNSHVVKLKHVKDIFDKKQISKFEKIKGKSALAETVKKQELLPPQPPFNLTSLQTEVYKFYGITPSRTLQIAQSLYLNGLISYPRTSSQKLPPSINYKEILEKLSKKFKTGHLLKRSSPVEGKKTDSAHPSIYPTGEIQVLAGEEEKIYNLVVKRFLSLFCEDAVLDRKRISLEIDVLKFSTSGSEVSKKAWMEIYPSKLKEVSLPDLNGEVKIINVEVEEKETQPPRRYSPASIVSELEKRNLGTKATRSSILETLYDRGYIQDKSIEATPLGISLIDTLEKYSPIITNENLTRSFEDSMESIVKSERGWQEKEEKVIEKAKKTIVGISKDFEKHENSIGKELVKATDELREKLRAENTLIECPGCKKGNLLINYSKKTRRFFVGCDSYPKCTQTYSLPPNGIIKKTDKVCDECGWPKLQRLSKGKRPWEFCFNPDCKTNEEWVERLKQKRKEYEKNKESQFF